MSAVVKTELLICKEPFDGKKDLRANVWSWTNGSVGHAILFIFPKI